jgi:hypothetical protein
MVVAEDRHRRVDARIGQRERLGRGLDRRRGPDRALGDHHGGGLDRHEPAAGRLVGAGSRADVDHGDRVAQRVVDQAGDPRVRVAGGRVGAADGVVER